MKRKSSQEGRENSPGPLKRGKTKEGKGRGWKRKMGVFGNASREHSVCVQSIAFRGWAARRRIPEHFAKVAGDVSVLVLSLFIFCFFGG